MIERSEAPYASPLALVKKPDNTYRVCVNFKELNKITVFDPEPMMSPDDIFPKLAGSKIYLFDFCKGYLYRQHFILESDHRPLEYLQTSHSKNPRIMRWSLSLQPYRYTVRCIRGSDNVVADYLSRSRE